MAQPTTKGRIHSIFRTLLQELQTDAASIAGSLATDEVRPWCVPAALEGVDLLDPSKLDAPFDRTEMNTNYAQVMQDPANPGTVGDVVALKQQIDYVAAAERAFRLRHCPMIRSIVHAHGRLSGHGAGGVFPGVQQMVEDVLKAGGVRT